MILSVLACFGLLPQMQATSDVSPPPDGCYPGFTTAEGCNALQHLGAGAGNTAFGWRSLYFVGGGNYNTGLGAGTLVLNTGDSNTAVGAAALLLNTGGTENTGVGTDALVHNANGNVNSAFGAFALFQTTGSNNTAIGDRALLNNTSGGSNTAVGQAAMLNNTSGGSNIAIGVQALGNNDSGTGNIVLGNVSGTAITSANNVICIGNLSADNVGNHTYIGNIGSTTVSGGGTDTVTVNLTTGLLGHLSSSRRYKEEIKPMDSASETLYRLNPVTYRYKKEIDATQSLDYGLVAEDVAEVDPNLAIHDATGRIESVRYTAINAMLLNEFLKEHKKVQDLEVTVAQQQKGMEVLTAQLKEQAAQIQKVSAQLEVSKPAPQIACLPAVASREGGNKP
jgi:hypothetical protein